MTILSTHGDETFLAVVCAILVVLCFVGGLKPMRRSLIAAVIAIALSALLIAVGKDVPRNGLLIANNAPRAGSCRDDLLVGGRRHRLLGGTSLCRQALDFLCTG